MLGAAALLLFVAERFDMPQPLAHRKLLVAPREMKDERFRETVILMLLHSKPSSVGLVINKPATDNNHFIGGPMEPDQKIYALHSLDVKLPATLEIGGLGLGLLDGAEAVRQLQTSERKPRWHIVLKGYAGWGKRQLTSELSRCGWHVIDYDAQLVTATPPERMWETAIRRPSVASDCAAGQKPPE